MAQDQSKQGEAMASGQNKRDWRLNDVTDELNARPFPRFGVPTSIFRLCLSGVNAFVSVQESMDDVLPDVDWDVAEQGKLIRGAHDGVRFNIERHTEFVSVTVIDEKAEGRSAAVHLPDGWLSQMQGEIVVAVDCYCVARGAANQAWTCASALEGGLADVFFDFKVAEDGHTKIELAFDAAADVRDVGRVALQVIEIETYRSFAAIGLPHARAAQARLSEIAQEIPRETPTTDDTMTAEERFQKLSQLAGELEEIWRQTSFRFNACQAYWSLVQARLNSLQEEDFDNRITVGGFLERRLSPAIATYRSTEHTRHNMAEQVGNMANFLQTRIELSLQRQNAELLSSLNHASERSLRLQHTVEGVSTVAISYYLVNLLFYPAQVVIDRYPEINPVLLRAGLVAISVPIVWLFIRRLLRTTVRERKK
jgi:uncharacterized membrane-anchored protein